MFHQVSKHLEVGLKKKKLRCVFFFNVLLGVFISYQTLALVFDIERFSIECRKTKTKIISLTNHNSGKQSNEPIRARSKHM